MDEITLEDEVNLALANAKRAQREVRSVVQGLARARDLISENVQPEEGTTDEQHREHS